MKTVTFLLLGTAAIALAGRQGDAGASKFFLSLDDDLMRIFGSDRMDGMLQRLGLKEGEAIVHPWINKALEKAQQKVEARNFDIRKNLLKFDNVMNDQRKVIFEQRIEMMDAEDVNETGYTASGSGLLRRYALGEGGPGPSRTQQQAEAGAPA